MGGETPLIRKKSRPKPKDLIPDKHLGVGLIDDAAVIAVCIAMTKTDLDVYDAWKDAKAQA